MNTIHKYKLDNIINETCLIQLPQYARILYVDSRDSEIYLWAYIHTSEPLIQRKFKCFKTGEECNFENDRIYLGSVEIHRGFLKDTRHVFEIIDF